MRLQCKPIRSARAALPVLVAAMIVNAVPAPAAGADPGPGPGFTIEGQVEGTIQLRDHVGDLQKLPTTEVPVSFVTGHGQKTGVYSGVLFWTILNDALLENGPGKGALLRHVITVTGSDGYAVVLSAGEIPPDFEGKSVILAIARDGTPLPPRDGIRLIVPGDKHGGRAVSDVAQVEVQ